MQSVDPIVGQTQVPATAILGFTFMVIMLAMLALVHTVRMCVHAVRCLAFLAPATSWVHSQAGFARNCGRTAQWQQPMHAIRNPHADKIVCRDTSSKLAR